MKSNNLKNLIRSALAEDIGPGDVTSKAVVPQGKMVKARVIAKERGIIAGLPVAELVFKMVDKKACPPKSREAGRRRMKVKAKVKDGKKVKKGKVIAVVSGPARSILTAERTALNFLQRMSGIATFTSQYLKKVRGLKVQILDTRKTAPGLRALDKYAVKMGGGTNHRLGLYDAVLIKENHIAVAGSIKNAVSKAKKAAKRMKIEVEARNLREISQAVDAGASNVLLDNMSVKTLRKAVRLVKKHNKRSKQKVKTEASGGVNLKNIRKIAQTGVNAISIGALTHSSKALDISLKII